MTDNAEQTKTPNAEGEKTTEGLKSPNEGYKDDARLDGNGNPLSEADAAKAVEDKKLADQKAVDDKPTGEGDKPKVEFDKSGLDQVTDLIKDAGLSMADVAKSVTAEDGKVTPAILKALEEKHGAGVASLIVSQLEGIHKSNVAVAQAKDKAVFDQVHEIFNDPQGGEETWKELSGWAKEKVPNEQRAELNKLLSQGGLAAKLAVNELVSMFKGSGDYTQSAQLEQGDELNNAPTTSMIDKVSYQNELRALMNAGEDYNSSVKIKELNRRREISMKRGI